MDCIISLFFVNLYNYENNNLSFSNIVTLIIIKKIMSGMYIPVMSCITNCPPLVKREE